MRAPHADAGESVSFPETIYERLEVVHLMELSYGMKRGIRLRIIKGRPGASLLQSIWK
jgi:hypothetical protein